MKKEKKSILKEWDFWAELCYIYAFAAVALYLVQSWVTMAILALCSGIVAFLKYRKMNKEHYEIEKLNRKAKRIIKKAKKQGDMSIVDQFLGEELIPALKKQLPKKIYKYYALGKDKKNDQRRLDTLRNNAIWSSIPSMLNDPFECRFTYLDGEELDKAGFTTESIELWDMIMEQVRQCLTTICFTQNPNDMPMWAHYANEHKGFCIEYEIVDTNNLYPVIYSENKLNARGQIVETIYGLFVKEATIHDKAIMFKHLILLCTYKDKSWESEHEIRAVFLNRQCEITNKGRRCSCREIGIKPIKIYIGVQCSEEHKEQLISIAEELRISYEVCKLSIGKKASVTAEQEKQNA